MNLIYLGIMLMITGLIFLLIPKIWQQMRRHRVSSLERTLSLLVMSSAAIVMYATATELFYPTWFLARLSSPATFALTTALAVEGIYLYLLGD